MQVAGGRSGIQACQTAQRAVLAKETALLTRPAVAIDGTIGQILLTMVMLVAGTILMLIVSILTRMVAFAGYQGRRHHGRCQAVGDRGNGAGEYEPQQGQHRGDAAQPGSTGKDGSRAHDVQNTTLQRWKVKA